MPMPYPQAIDEMFAQFRAAWNAGAGAVAGSIPEIRWPGLEKAGNQATDVYWCRVSQQGVDEYQTGFSNGALPGSNRRYTAYGLIFIQLFAPIADAEALEKLRLLAQLARDAYRGKQTPGGAVFNHCRIRELDPEEMWQRINVIVEYEFDMIG
jgi:hypothetical protein